MNREKKVSRKRGWFVFIALLALPIILQAQAWQQVYPNFPADDIMAMVQWNGDTLFAFGLNWTIQKSVDAGATWTTIRHNANGYNIIRAYSNGSSIILLPAVSYGTPNAFADTTSMFLFSFNPYSNDTIRITLPIFFPLHSSSNFFDLSVSPDCIAVLQNTSRVAVALSSDRGMSWSSVALPDTLGDRVTIPRESSVYFRNRMHGVVICDARSHAQAPLAFVTQDGGQSWTQAPNVQYAFLLSQYIKFPAAWVNDSTIVLFTNGTRAVISRDYGKTWTTGDRINGWICNVSFASDGVGYAVGKLLDVYKTLDYGKTWITAKDALNTLNVIMPAGITISHDNCIVGSACGYIIKTSDGGVTWDLIHFNDEWSILSAAFFTRNTGVIQYTSRSDKSLKFSMTSDGGRTWGGAFSPPGDSRLVPVSERVFYGFQPSWGHNGTLVILSTDGGNSWTDMYKEKLSDSTKWINNGSANQGIDTMLFLTNKGILYTSDRGKNWVIKPEILNHSLSKAAGVPRFMGRSRNGYYWVLSKNDFLKSDDDGNTWHSIFSTPDSVKNNGLVEFCDASDNLLYLFSENWYTSSDAVMYQSTDAGKTWTSYNINPIVGGLSRVFPSGRGLSQAQLNAVNTVLFYSTTDAWRTFSESYVFSYSNPGMNTPNTVVFDENNSWFAQYTFILCTTNGGVNGIESPPPVASGIALDPAYPNPASSSATISFTVSGAHDAAVQIDVYDAMGRKIWNIFTGGKAPGKHSALFDASRLRAGVYFVRMTTEKEMRVEKMVVMK